MPPASMPPASTLADALPASAEDVRLLADLGFMALGRGREADAEAIFEGVRALRPGAEAGPLGLALVEMGRGRLDQAVTRLRALPPSETALTFLGLALRRQGAREEAREVLAHVVATAPDAPVAGLAREALAAIESGRAPT